MQQAQNNSPKAEPTFARRFPAYIAVTCVGWIAAGTFLIAKQTTAIFEPLELGWFRIELSFLLIWLVYLASPKNKQEQEVLTRRDKLSLILLGLTGVTANQLLFLHGIKYASPIDAALLYAFTPVLVIIAARFLLNEFMTWQKLSGIACATTGVIIVLADRGLTLAREHFYGDLLLVFAVLAWATYTLIGKSLVGRIGALRANAHAFGVAGITMLPLTPRVLTDFDWAAPGWAGWLGMAYLAGMTSVISFTLWAWALKRLDAGQVAVFSNLQPAFTAVLAWLFLDQIPTWMVVLGGILVFSGVVIAQHVPKPNFVQPSGK